MQLPVYSFICIDRDNFISFFFVNKSFENISKIEYFESQFKMYYYRHEWSYWPWSIIRGLSGKYPAILNISRTGRVALM